MDSSSLNFNAHTNPMHFCLPWLSLTCNTFSYLHAGFWVGHHCNWWCSGFKGISDGSRGSTHMVWFERPPLLNHVPPLDLCISLSSQCSAISPGLSERPQRGFSGHLVPCLHQSSQRGTLRSSVAGIAAELTGSSPGSLQLQAPHWGTVHFPPWMGKDWALPMATVTRQMPPGRSNA